MITIAIIIMIALISDGKYIWQTEKDFESQQDDCYLDWADEVIMIIIIIIIIIVILIIIIIIMIILMQLIIILIGTRLRRVLEKTGGNDARATAPIRFSFYPITNIYTDTNANANANTNTNTNTNTNSNTNIQIQKLIFRDFIPVRTHLAS